MESPHAAQIYTDFTRGDRPPAADSEAEPEHLEPHAPQQLRPHEVSSGAEVFSSRPITQPDILEINRSWIPIFLMKLILIWIKLFFLTHP